MFDLQDCKVCQLPDCRRQGSTEVIASNVPAIAISIHRELFAYEQYMNLMKRPYIHTDSLHYNETQQPVLQTDQKSITIDPARMYAHIINAT